MSEALNSPEAKSRRFRSYPKYKESGVEWLGEIPASWRVSKFRQFATRGNEFASGPFGSNIGSSFYQNEGVPVIRGNNLSINGEKPKYNNNGYAFISELKANELSHSNAIAGDLVFTARGTTGQVGLIPLNSGFRRFILSANQLRFRPDPTVWSGDFLWYLFSSTFIRSQVFLESESVAQPNLNLGSLKGLRVIVPPLSDQNDIVEFLDSETAEIDALIAKKQRLIELLQEKRTALITHAVTKGLDPNVPMKDSGIEWLGQIPAQWDVLRLKYLSSINDEVLNEKTDPRFELIYVDIGGVDQYQGIVASEELVFETAPSRARRIVRDGDVIISTVRTYLRAIAPIKHPESNLIVSTGFAVIRPSSALESNFAPYALRASHFIESVVANSDGVSYPAIDTSKMSCFSVATPDLFSTVEK